MNKIEILHPPKAMKKFKSNPVESATNNKALNPSKNKVAAISLINEGINEGNSAYDKVAT